MRVSDIIVDRVPERFSWFERGFLTVNAKHGTLDQERSSCKFQVLPSNFLQSVLQRRTQQDVAQQESQVQNRYSSLDSYPFPCPSITPEPRDLTLNPKPGISNPQEAHGVNNIRQR